MTMMAVRDFFLLFLSSDPEKEGEKKRGLPACIPASSVLLRRR